MPFHPAPNTLLHAAICDSAETHIDPRDIELEIDPADRTALRMKVFGDVEDPLSKAYGRQEPERGVVALGRITKSDETWL